MLSSAAFPFRVFNLYFLSVPSSVVAPALPVARPVSAQRSLFPVLLLGGGLALLWFIAFRHLSAEWSYNEQYSYGWFVPFFALYLFWLRWQDRPQPAIKQKVRMRKPGAAIWNVLAVAVAVGSILLLLPIRLIEVANPDWRPVSWLHSSIAVVLTLFVLWRMGGVAWLRHFAFPAVFTLISVPWISAIEVPVIQGLMPTLASIATEALSLIGIPAEVQGNLVRINGGIVGVNEACSGVRSLQTSLMIGLLFGELRRLSVVRRLLLVVGAIAIAFTANCGRAFFLVWIASRDGVSAVEKWHDIAGYTIVGLVFVGCLVMTSLLAGGETGKASPARPPNDNEHGSIGRQMSDSGREISHPVSDLRDRPSLITYALSGSTLAVVLVWLVLTEIAVEWWYRSHETNLPRTAQWSVRWPTSAPDYRELPIDDRTRAVLHFDKGKGASWKLPNDSTTGGGLAGAASRPVSLLYFFRWEPGHNSALLANAHRPDVCLPATGWRQTEDRGVAEYRITPNLTIPFRHFVFTHDAGGRIQYAHAFYCVWEDRVRRFGQSNLDNGMKGDPSAWTRNERLQAVWQGRRHLGQQVLEYLLLQPHARPSEEADAVFAHQVASLIVAAAR